MKAVPTSSSARKMHRKVILPGILFLYCLQISMFSTQAQILYGTTTRGGDEDEGTISKFVVATNKLTVLKSFERSAASPVYTNLIQASNGQIYGMTSQGGASGHGVIFSFDPASSVYKRLKNFKDSSGTDPFGSLIVASDGKLYGMTSKGGNHKNGVIFSFDPFTATYTKLKDFDGINGAHPYGSLVQASDGKLYGMTNIGGKGNYGVIFSFDPSTLVYIKLTDFDSTNGASPYGSLVQASDGKLYGMTANGGSSNNGVIFSFDPALPGLQKLKDFDYYSLGGQPHGSLVQASDGKLYGMTTYGGSSYGGVIFSLDPASSIYTKLVDFYADGAHPFGSLIQASDGKLYGMTSLGGSGQDGVIFSFDPASFTYTKIKDFDGAYRDDLPYGSLMQANDGKLYGMTTGTYENDNGVIFSFSISSSGYVVLKDFNNNETGSIVSSSLTRAKDGKLYGMTSAGGSKGYGVIFCFDLSSGIYIKCRDFDDTTGAPPDYGSLIQATDGKLYGMTTLGGKNGVGIIFSFDPASSVFKTLMNFDGTNGATPYGSLMQAKDGKLYGMTYAGGSGNYGVIFSFDPATFRYQKLKDLINEYNGSLPYGSLIQASDGRLYGLTSSGGSSGRGVIFSFDPATAAYKKLKNLRFNSYGSLIQATNGKLYGLNFGNIFSYDPSSATYKDLPFNVTNGSPIGSLVQASDGKLYGRTGQGYEGWGYIFSFDPSSVTYTGLKQFTGNDGAFPSYGSAFIEVKDSTPGKAPTVSLKTPADNATYLAGGNVYLNAVASDADGTINKVEFYSGTTLLYTATDTPYTFKWQHVRQGNYTLVAKATDNSRLVTTSDSVHIKVVPNTPPAVGIISPANGQTFIAPATINLEASAQDIDGRIIQVSFYNGPVLLTNSEHKVPYTYQWQNVPAGTYTLTAIAKDNWTAETTSAPITVTVKLPGLPLVSSKSSSAGIKTGLDEEVSLQLAPNPAKNILNINIKGLQKNQRSTISVLSATGVIFQTKQSVTTGLIPTIQLNVASLVSGTYIIKMVSGDKVMYKQFVKM